MINTDTARQLARLTLANGGATARQAPDGLAFPVTGYAVALPGCERTYPLPPQADALAGLVRAYSAEHADTLAPADRYLGTWVDGRTVYLDTVEVYADRAAAELAGIAAGQLAIFDLAAGSEIRLTPAQVTR